MARGRTERRLAGRIGADAPAGRSPLDLLVEEPLEIRLDDEVVATTMRTPGHDFELAVGFCHAEGLLGTTAPVRVRYCATGSAVESGFNVVTVSAPGGGRPAGAAPARPRTGTVTSSCGWCGTDVLADLGDRLSPVERAEVPPAELLVAVDRSVAAEQALFAATGSAHAAAAFDRSDGTVRVVREDIGRHNAVDKVVGRLRLDDGLPADGLGLWVSGRASFEIVQKAWAAGIGLVVAVSAPSALAVRTAERAGITLVGCSRADGATVYARPG